MRMDYIDVAELELKGCNDAVGCRGMGEGDVQDPREKTMVLFAESRIGKLLVWDERIGVRDRGVL